MFFSNQELPKPKKVTQNKTSTTAPKKVGSISLSKIYENDLFDTIKQPLPEIHEAAHLQDAPTAPSKSNPVIPVEPAEQALPALKISLKGIMVINDNSKNIAIIADNATTKEKNYKTNDMIQDAQIIKIFNNRVLLIRSNGQEETLYLSDKDVLTHPLTIQEKAEWSGLVAKAQDNVYEIDPIKLKTVIPNLSTFIDMFDIVTVFKEGKSIGCRIGGFDKKSLSHALGLENYDLITQINGHAVTTFDERLAAYDELMKLTLNDSFTAEITRNKAPIKITYKLASLENSLLESLLKTNPAGGEKIGIIETLTPEELEQHQIAMLKEKYQFAPTMQEILLQQKKAMLHEGQENRLADFSFPSET